ncbi:hypothetical protein SEPCBS57363_005289 [Sporothrix epigloea]|uniref:PQ loop repeat protein n=1 Tax=Sporothrix epigloea TaxID=1892477 RepID=A0ABP0DWZ8_9PEZI
MAPQTSIPVTANVLGCEWQIERNTNPATVLALLIPQIWTNWRTKATDGLPALMMFLWAVCGVPFGAYAIIQNFNVPIQIQPQVFMSLSLVSWVQILIYGNKWPVKKAVFTGIMVAILFGGIEIMLILTLKPVYERGVEVPTLVVGALASILLAAGLIPPYFEIYKRRGRVAGINFVFLAMDWNGAFFSLMAIVTQNTFDVLGGILYITCVLLEIGIFLCHIIWMVRTRMIRKRAKEEGKTFDELAAEIVAVEGDSWPFAERPLHPCFTSAWWRSRLTGKPTRPPSVTTTDEEKAMPNERVSPATAVPTSTLKYECDTAEVGTTSSKPAACSEGGVPSSKTNGNDFPNTANACDDTSRSCSVSVAPTQYGDADVEINFDDKQ